MARFGPDTATCEVFTTREGVLAAAGHDLKLRAQEFEIEADATSVRARLDPSSLRVVAAMRGGRGDASAPSERDRREIALQLARSLSLFTTEGFVSDTAGEAYARAHELSERWG